MVVKLSFSECFFFFSVKTKHRFSLTVVIMVHQKFSLAINGRLVK